MIKSHTKPYGKFRIGGKWVVRKMDADGRPVGTNLGEHTTSLDANTQIAALYASEKGDYEVDAKAIAGNPLLQKVLKILDAIVPEYYNMSFIADIRKNTPSSIRRAIATLQRYQRIMRTPKDEQALRLVLGILSGYLVRLAGKNPRAITTDDLGKAALEYIDRRDRGAHPDGTFDKAGRWWPSSSERRPCCKLIRQPSRAHPYSYMVHCRTIPHVAQLFNVPEAALKERVKQIDAGYTGGVARRSIMTKGNRSMKSLVPANITADQAKEYVRNIQRVYDGAKKALDLTDKLIAHITSVSAGGDTDARAVLNAVVRARDDLKRIIDEAADDYIKLKKKFNIKSKSTTKASWGDKPFRLIFFAPWTEAKLKKAFDEAKKQYDDALAQYSTIKGFADNWAYMPAKLGDIYRTLVQAESIIPGNQFSASMTAISNALDLTKEMADGWADEASKLKKQVDVLKANMSTMNQRLRNYQTTGRT